MAYRISYEVINQWYERLLNATRCTDDEKRYSMFSEAFKEFLSKFSVEMISNNKELNKLNQHFENALKETKRIVDERKMVTGAIIKAQNDIFLDYNNFSALDELKSKYELNAESSTIASLILSKELSIETIVDFIIVEHENILNPKQYIKSASGFIDPSY